MAAFTLRKSGGGSTVRGGDRLRSGTDLAVGPTPTGLVFATVVSAIVLGSVTVSPPADALVMSTGTPTVILGDLTLTPAQVVAILATLDPTVSIASALQPFFIRRP